MHPTTSGRKKRSLIIMCPESCGAEQPLPAGAHRRLAHKALAVGRRRRRLDQRAQRGGDVAPILGRGGHDVLPASTKASRSWVMTEAAWASGATVSDELAA